MSESLFWGAINLISLPVGIIAISSLVIYSDKRSNLAKKVFGVIALVVIFYWTTTTPFVDTYYSLNTSKLNASTESNEIKHIQNHEDRIANLEKELKDAKDDIKSLRDHYYRFWQFIMFASILIIGIKIFGKVGEKSENQTN